MSRFTMLICFVPLLGTARYHVKKHKQLPGKNIRIYLLMGQSNMAGRGKITTEYAAIQNPRVIMLTKDNEWVTARHPLHFDKPNAVGVGPGLSFGISMAKAYPQDTIALVPCAVGGTSINKWEPGAYDKATNTHPYDDAVLRISAAIKKGSIKGVIWLQGESDSDLRTIASQNYIFKLKALVNNIRHETNEPSLPFVVGELGRYRDNYVVFNKQLE